MKRLNVLLAAVGIALVCSSAMGLEFSDVLVSESVGSGSNSAMCVVDFGAGNSFAFQYFWDGDATSEDMILSFDGNTGLDFGYSYSSMGMYISSISYGGFSIVDDSDWTEFTGGYPSSWWSGHDAYSYEDWYTSEIVNVPAMYPDGVNWVYAGLGAAERTLQDGYWDGWTYASVDGTSSAPVVPVPEPMSMVLLALGGIGIIRIRRG